MAITEERLTAVDAPVIYPPDPLEYVEASATTIDDSPINYDAPLKIYLDGIPEPLERKVWKMPRPIRWLMAGTAALTGAGAYLGALNYPLIETIVHRNDPRAMVPNLPGCEINPQAEVSTLTSPKTDLIFAQVQNAKSGTHTWEPTPHPDAPYASSDLILGFFDTKITKITEPKSGITFDIWSDSNDGPQIDPAAFTQLFTDPLENLDAYQDPKFSNFMKCAQDRILNKRQFAGTQITVYIPSKSNMCYNGLFVITLSPDQSSKNNCHSNGFTKPPHTQLRIGLMTFLDHYLMATSGGNNDSKIANLRIAKSLQHEIGHQYLALLGINLRLDPDEEFARYEEESMAAFYNGHRPLAVIYS